MLNCDRIIKKSHWDVIRTTIRLSKMKVNPENKSPNTWHRQEWNTNNPKIRTDLQKHHGKTGNLNTVYLIKYALKYAVKVAYSPPSHLNICQQLNVLKSISYFVAPPSGQKQDCSCTASPLRPAKTVKIWAGEQRNDLKQITKWLKGMLLTMKIPFWDKLFLILILKFCCQQARKRRRRKSGYGYTWQNI